MTETCPKCGWQETTCKYRGPVDDSFDALQWTCLRCGYTWRTPTLEEKKLDRMEVVPFPDNAPLREGPSVTNPAALRRGPGRPRKNA